jgi:hypothetical protein
MGSPFCRDKSVLYELSQKQTRRRRDGCVSDFIFCKRRFRDARRQSASTHDCLLERDTCNKARHEILPWNATDGRNGATSTLSSG